VVEKSNQKNKNPAFLGLIFILLAGVLFFLNETQKNAPGYMEMSSIELQSQETQNKINRHLQETSRKMFLQERNGMIETSKTMRRLESSRPQPRYQIEREVVIPNSEDMHEFNEQVGRGQKVPGMPTDPAQRIQEELSREQAEHQYSEAYKKEYARQFVENARSQGWEVQMDGNYKVISVRPLRKRLPTSDVFSENPGGGN
jgi:hypothetical protein